MYISVFLSDIKEIISTKYKDRSIENFCTNLFIKTKESLASIVDKIA
jgi:hypothetical protein